MGKKKRKNKRRLLSSQYYYALERLRNGVGLHRQKNGVLQLREASHLTKYADEKKLGFDYMTTKEFEDSGDFARTHPQQYQDAWDEIMSFDEAYNKPTDGAVFDSQIKGVLKKYPQMIGLIRANDYATNCADEFDLWLESNKFEIDWGCIEEILPTGVDMYDFFGHVQTRLPYEKCLYVAKINSEETLFLRANEVSIQDSIEFWGGQRPRMTVQEKQSQEATGDINLDATLHRWESLGVESVAKVRVSVAIDNEFTFFPADVIVPIGVPISDLRTCEYPSQTIGKSHYSIINKELSYVEEKLYDTSDENYITNTGSLCARLSQTLLCYSSVLLDPQFREFAVKEENYSGMTNDFLRESKIINLNTPIEKSISQRPMFEHKVLTLNIPKGVQNPSGSGNRKEGTRLHSVRGHMMRTKKGKLVWRKAHWRGKEKFGVIKKEYNIPNQQAV